MNVQPSQKSRNYRDPYVLEFLNLNDRYLKKYLEDAIMREIEQFLLELDTGFYFLARQKNITTDDENFRIDLFFFLDDETFPHLTLLQFRISLSHRFIRRREYTLQNLISKEM